MSGKKKVDSKTFHLGKGFKTDSKRTSVRGFPNTNLDTYNKNDGKLRGRKKYGADGFAVKDLNVGHYDHNKEDHAHDYHGTKRSEKRSLTKKEQRELDKAKKKRRFWQND